MMTNTNTLTNDDARDIAIRVVDHLIEKLQWEPQLNEGDPGEWYPWELQDEIKDILKKALGVRDDD
jgi:hypothetical protein